MGLNISHENSFQSSPSSSVPNNCDFGGMISILPIYHSEEFENPKNKNQKLNRPISSHQLMRKDYLLLLFYQALYKFFQRSEAPMVFTVMSFGVCCYPAPADLSADPRASPRIFYQSSCALSISISFSCSASRRTAEGRLMVQQSIGRLRELLEVLLEGKQPVQHRLLVDGPAPAVLLFKETLDKQRR